MFFVMCYVLQVHVYRAERVPGNAASCVQRSCCFALLFDLSRKATLASIKDWY